MRSWIDLFIYFAQRGFYSVLSLGFLISSSSTSGEGERWGKDLAKTRLGPFSCIFSGGSMLVMKSLTQEFEVHGWGVGWGGGSERLPPPPQLPSTPIGWPPATPILEGLGLCCGSLVGLSSLTRKWLLLLSWDVGGVSRLFSAEFQVGVSIHSFIYSFIIHSFNKY